MSNRIAQALSGLGEEYDLFGTKLKLMPLTGKHLAYFNSNQDDDPEVAYKIVFESLKRADPEITYEDVLEIPVGTIGDMMESVMKVSGVNQDKLEKLQEESQTKKKG